MKKVTNRNRKRKIIHYRRSYRYPNVADASYYWNKLSDSILTVATTCGAATILFFLFTMA